MTRTVAIVSPHFPPSALASVHRARHLAKHLPQHGWRPIVVRVSEAYYPERLDPALAALVPADVQQVATKAIPLALTKTAGVSDIGLRSYFQLKRAVAQLAGANALDAVMITGFPFYPMLLSGWITKSLGVPVILDFQDPWVSAWGANLPRFSKGGLAHQLATVLEPQALRGAAFVTSVSQVQNQEMASRYAWLDAQRMAAIEIGGDPEDFAGIGAKPVHAAAEIEFAFVGSVWPGVMSTLEVFLDGVQQALMQTPSLSAQLKVRFYGTDARLRDPPIYQVREHAQKRGLGHIVEEHPARLAFVDALGVMARAHALVLLGSGEPHYTASKIYPALMAQRPYLSVFHARSSAHQILTAAGGGIALGFDDNHALQGLSGPISQAIAALVQTPERFACADVNAYRDHTANAVAGKFAKVFDRVCAGGAP